MKKSIKKIWIMKRQELNINKKIIFNFFAGINDIFVVYYN